MICTAMFSRTVEVLILPTCKIWGLGLIAKKRVEKQTDLEKCRSLSLEWI
jgi:hypothetical protein